MRKHIYLEKLSGPDEDIHTEKTIEIGGENGIIFVYITLGDGYIVTLGYNDVTHIVVNCGIE